MYSVSVQRKLVGKMVSWGAVKVQELHVGRALSRARSKIIVSFWFSNSGKRSCIIFLGLANKLTEIQKKHCLRTLVPPRPRALLAEPWNKGGLQLARDLPVLDP